VIAATITVSAENQTSCSRAISNRVPVTRGTMIVGMRMRTLKQNAKGAPISMKRKRVKNAIFLTPQSACILLTKVHNRTAVRYA